MNGRVAAICISKKKGQQKIPLESARLIRGHGIEGDAHAGNWHRQVSLLAQEDIDSLRREGLELSHGAFAENIVVNGLCLKELNVGDRFRIGPEAVLQMTQRGKECHAPCAIYHKAGRCIMPTDGIFARVVLGGSLRPGDEISMPEGLNKFRYHVVTISDRGFRGESEDHSAPQIDKMLKEITGSQCLGQEVIPDEFDIIASTLIRLCDHSVCDLIVTTGGTGLAPRDQTPEATRSVIDREIPGMAEAIRTQGYKITPRAMLSRGVCGMRDQTLIVNLSGSPKAVKEQLEVITPVLGHVLETASGIPQSCGKHGGST